MRYPVDYVSIILVFINLIVPDAPYFHFVSRSISARVPPPTAKKHVIVCMVVQPIGTHVKVIDRTNNYHNPAN